MNSERQKHPKAIGTIQLYTQRMEAVEVPIIEVFQFEGRDMAIILDMDFIQAMSPYRHDDGLEDPAEWGEYQVTDIGTGFRALGWCASIGSAKSNLASRITKAKLEKALAKVESEPRAKVRGTVRYPQEASA